MLNLKNAYFTGKDEFPVLRAQSNDFQRPFQMIRFSDRKDASLNDAICFYEWDLRFERQLDDHHLGKLILDFKRAGSVVQPDYSIFADEPLILQKMAVFNKNRVACELQSYGIEIIPNLRWGDRRSFEFAFSGIPKHQICAVGTYGQIRDKERRYLFEAGLEQALKSSSWSMEVCQIQFLGHIRGRLISINMIIGKSMPLIRRWSNGIWIQWLRSY